MLRYQVWECDVCGLEVEYAVFPREWIDIEIRKGHYYSDDGGLPELDKDCCSQKCANKVVLDYYSEHRLEE